MSSTRKDKVQDLPEAVPWDEREVSALTPRSHWTEQKVTCLTRLEVGGGGSQRRSGISR